MKNEVTDEIKNIIVDQAEREVLDEYTPKRYHRRDSLGIDDPDVYSGRVHGDMELSIENELQFNPFGSENSGIGLGELINDGEGEYQYDYGEFDHDGEYTKPRPYWDKAAEIVENTDRAEDALAKGLKMNGNSVK